MSCRGVSLKIVRGPLKREKRKQVKRGNKRDECGTVKKTHWPAYDSVDFVLLR